MVLTTEKHFHLPGSCYYGYWDWVAFTMASLTLHTLLDLVSLAASLGQLANNIRHARPGAPAQLPRSVYIDHERFLQCPDSSAWEFNGEYGTYAGEAIYYFAQHVHAKDKQSFSRQMATLVSEDQRKVDRKFEMRQGQLSLVDFQLTDALTQQSLIAELEAYRDSILACLQASHVAQQPQILEMFHETQ